MLRPMWSPSTTVPEKKTDVRAIRQHRPHPLEQRLADLGRADCHFVDQRGWYFLQLKAIDRSHDFQILVRTLPVASEPVIIADHQRRGSDGIYQNVPHKFRGGNAGKFLAERLNDQVIDPCFTQQSFTFFDGRDQFEAIVIRLKDGSGVRKKSKPPSPHRRAPPAHAFGE